MAFHLLTAKKVRQERFGVFSPQNLHFSKGPARGARSRYPEVSGFVLKASEKLLKPDALGASFASGLVFSCWESWGHTGAMPWGGCCIPVLLPPRSPPPGWDNVPGPLLG